ncbi:hypothetical protein BU24DRAFT_481686 [Aaosphaeria arxii CBS 175.79]|uniref:Uncharacterized protein n=1 Tax=Aaosphaeria arxii CBS 175.79 TaxID=1450172 RepID=A0A6A5XMX4_9PLEO|nr:uncharacterized protein BU24DRAFT_481686 [Aaosphaeria arxii CBS 175.79]KAF2014266.1 hypothetical protein BU24DRAFT_481686 [Aaosphaeria arxii CBS 175.79]
MVRISLMSWAFGRFARQHSQDPYRFSLLHNEHASSSESLASEISMLYFAAQGTEHVPAIASYNRPPTKRLRTPLFIPFTRNNAMLRQTVLGYISAGWPRTDIVIIDNSGTFDANDRKQLSEQNPFFLDYDLFRNRYGVSIQQTPTLLNFAQLQNYLLRQALARDWPYYFWSHMDVGILSEEEDVPYVPFYHRVLDIMKASNVTKDRIDGNWAAKFFQFDNLMLVNVEVWRNIGQWDAFIPYYATDCDAYGRARMLGHTTDNVRAGHIFDVADVVSNPELKFFPLDARAASGQKLSAQSGKSTGDEVKSERYRSLRNELQKLSNKKLRNPYGRNTWQNKQKGGKGEPWTYDPIGFQDAWWQTAEAGRALFVKKWGTDNCNLHGANVTMYHEWRKAQDVTARDIGHYT